jgi:2-succinyl-6-hydroxy-2,4-cyclohexadiene-1-carboxylate synthase
MGLIITIPSGIFQLRLQLRLVALENAVLAAAARIAYVAGICRSALPGAMGARIQEQSPVQLSYQVHAGSGPHLLLVHGFLTGPSQWLSNLPALAGHCTPVTVSLRGHAGAASPHDPGAYDPDHYVACFDAIRRDLGVDQWFLLGYSLGAGLTIRYALEYPQRVLGHAFTNSTSALAADDQQRRWLSAADESADKVLKGGRAAMERIPVHPRHARNLPKPVYQALCDDAQRHDPLGIANTLRRTNPQASVRARLAENARPTLLICGTRERRFQPHRAYAATAMPHLAVVDLDAGHGMNMEDPQGFDAAVIDFIKRHTAP